MQNDERRRLMKLRDDTDDVGTFEAINQTLYENAPVYRVDFSLRLVDPLLESGLDKAGTIGAVAKDTILDQILDVLPGEWYDPGRGASWWVSEYLTHDAQAKGYWETIGDGDVGELPPKRDDGVSNTDASAMADQASWTAPAIKAIIDNYLADLAPQVASAKKLMTDEILAYIGIKEG